MDPVTVFLMSTVMPAALAAVGLFLVGGTKDPKRQMFQALILALGFILGAYFVHGRLEFPPILPADSMNIVALLLAVFVIIAPKDVGARYAMRAVFVLLCGAAILIHIRASLGGMVNMRNMVAFFCLALGIWSIVERSARQMSLLALISVPLVSASFTAVILVLSGNASFAQMLGVNCGLLGAALAVALIKPARISAFALLPFLSVFVVMFMVVGHFYSDINPWWFVYLSWPFAVIWVRPWLPAIKNAYVETILLVVISAAPLAWWAKQVADVKGLPM